MKRWIPVSEVEPSELTGVVSGRFYGSGVMFVAFDKFFRHWVWVYGGGEERINEPEALLLEEDWAAAHPRKTPFVRSEKTGIRRKKGAIQLEMF